MVPVCVSVDPDDRDLRGAVAPLDRVAAHPLLVDDDQAGLEQQLQLVAHAPRGLGDPLGDLLDRDPRPVGDGEQHLAANRVGHRRDKSLELGVVRLEARSRVPLARPCLPNGSDAASASRHSRSGRLRPAARRTCHLQRHSRQGITQRVGRRGALRTAATSPVRSAVPPAPAASSSKVAAATSGPSCLESSEGARSRASQPRRRLTARRLRPRCRPRRRGPAARRGRARRASAVGQRLDRDGRSRSPAPRLAARPCGQLLEGGDQHAVGAVEVPEESARGDLGALGRSAAR